MELNFVRDYKETGSLKILYRLFFIIEFINFIFSL